MKVTAIFKDFSEQFYNGTESGSIPAFLKMAPADQWAKVNQLHRDKRVTLKIGSGQIRDAVELTAMLRKPCSMTFKLEPRKGYKLATFSVAPADGPDHCDYYPAAWTVPH